MPYLDCPHCDGEKVYEPNAMRWADALHMAGGNVDVAWMLAKWHPEDGVALNEEESCPCPLTPAEAEALEDRALAAILEPTEP